MRQMDWATRGPVAAWFFLNENKGEIMIGKRAATIKGLLARGYIHEQIGRSKKYVEYSRPGERHRILIGKSGGVRHVVDGQPVSQSSSLTGTRFHRELAEIGGYRWPARAVS